MTIREKLLALWNERPFRPFTLDLSNGRHLQVTTPENIFVGNKISTVHDMDPDGMDRIVTVQHCNINTVDEYDPVQSPGAATE